MDVCLQWVLVIPSTSGDRSFQTRSDHGTYLFPRNGVTRGPEIPVAQSTILRCQPKTCTPWKGSYSSTIFQGTFVRFGSNSGAPSPKALSLSLHTSHDEILKLKAVACPREERNEKCKKAEKGLCYWVGGLEMMGLLDKSWSGLC